jgi:hypothetical protein
MSAGRILGTHPPRKKTAIIAVIIAALQRTKKTLNVMG